MPVYNLLEYSSNYSVTTGSLWFCSKDESANFNANFVINNNLNLSNIKVDLKIQLHMEQMEF